MLASRPTSAEEKREDREGSLKTSVGKRRGTTREVKKKKTSGVFLPSKCQAFREPRSTIRIIVREALFLVVVTSQK